MQCQYTRRNGHSDISALPSGILAKIFLDAKDGVLGYGAPKEAGRLNVAGVCRDWRNIALASPQLWSSINLSRSDCALELLKRSKSAPLRIHCKSTPLTITAANKDIVKSIMAEVDRIQEIDVRATAGSDILWLMSSTRGASAPLLEQLRLENLRWSTTSLPLHVIPQEFPSLRHLQLTNIDISKLPRMPQLTHLEILLRDQSVILFSSLLSSLRRSPTLEEIQISGMVKNDLADSPSRIKLPRLTCLSITSVDLEAAAIFAYLEYPANTRVAFRSTRLPAEELDLTNVIAIRDRFLEPGAPALHGIKISDSRSDGPFQLSASYRGHSHSGEDADEDADEDDDYIDFSISLTIHYCDSAAACEALCSALPLETVHTLKVGGFDGMAQEQWKTIFRRCKCVKHAQFNGVPVCLFQNLVQTEGPLLLPKLEVIELILCTFIKPENRHTKPETSPSLRIFEGFLEQRKKLKKPVEVSLILCLITPEAVESLEKYAPIWCDGEDVYYEEDEEDYSYDEEDDDDEEGDDDEESDDDEEDD
ncbi:hypothetical protein EYR38_001568 [Pleurotus pulmonarius]|nr:hypothetical protein EYR38_001568 [Pleurotus pulmonarius]